ncbi:MAG: ABC transporter permease subunit, partial [Proteobacteria bacterium]|nr:ABC transporter permease subunit [Pseudomonadota bacterium]
MTEQLAAAVRDLPANLASHVLLSAAAMALALCVSLPLAFAALRSPKLRSTALAFASIVQTIPGLALLALFYPLLLAISSATKAVFGVSVPALGFLPSLLALALYAVLPVLRNTVVGLTSIDPKVLEAADGVGMTEREKLRLVQLPLAAPVIMAGIRTASVWTIGAATLATSVGQRTLGNYIFSGLQTENWISVLFGCLAATALALVADGLLALVETGIANRRRSAITIGAAGLAVGIALAVVPLLITRTQPYVIGAKNFSEQFILADVMSRRLEAAGHRVERKESLGSAVAFRALAASDIDAYVDYTGTIWANVLGRTDTPPAATMLAEITRILREKYGILVMGSLGFENAYVLAMSSERAAADHIVSLADLAPLSPRMTLGNDLEFLSLP